MSNPKSTAVASDMTSHRTSSKEAEKNLNENGDASCVLMKSSRNVVEAVIEAGIESFGERVMLPVRGSIPSTRTSDYGNQPLLQNRPVSATASDFKRDPFTRIFLKDQGKLRVADGGEPYSGDSTDLKITCQDGHFYVHRAVVLSLSNALQILVQGRESEEEAGIILTGFGLAPVKALFTAFYTGYIPLRDNVRIDEIEAVNALIGLQNLELSVRSVDDDKELVGFAWDPEASLPIILPSRKRMGKKRKKDSRHHHSDSQGQQINRLTSNAGTSGNACSFDNPTNTEDRMSQQRSNASDSSCAQHAGLNLSIREPVPESWRDVVEKSSFSESKRPNRQGISNASRGNRSCDGSMGAIGTENLDFPPSIAKVREAPPAKITPRKHSKEGSISSYRTACPSKTSGHHSSSDSTTESQHNQNLNSSYSAPSSMESMPIPEVQKVRPEVPGPKPPRPIRGDIWSSKNGRFFDSHSEFQKVRIETPPSKVTRKLMKTKRCTSSSNDYSSNATTTTTAMSMATGLEHQEFIQIESTESNPCALSPQIRTDVNTPETLLKASLLSPQLRGGFTVVNQDNLSSCNACPTFFSTTTINTTENSLTMSPTAASAKTTTIMAPSTFNIEIQTKNTSKQKCKSSTITTSPHTVLKLTAAFTTENCISANNNFAATSTPFVRLSSEASLIPPSTSNSSVMIESATPMRSTTGIHPKILSVASTVASTPEADPQSRTSTGTEILKEKGMAPMGEESGAVINAKIGQPCCDSMSPYATESSSTSSHHFVNEAKTTETTTKIAEGHSKSLTVDTFSAVSEPAGRGFEHSNRFTRNHFSACGRDDRELMPPPISSGCSIKIVHPIGVVQPDAISIQSVISPSGGMAGGISTAALSKSRPSVPILPFPNNSIAVQSTSSASAFSLIRNLKQPSSNETASVVSRGNIRTARIAPTTSSSRRKVSQERRVSERLINENGFFSCTVCNIRFEVEEEYEDHMCV